MSGFDAPEFEACSTPEATACSAVLAWQQGRLDPDGVTEVLLDATGGDEVETRRLMEMGVRWYDRYARLARSSRVPPASWEPQLTRERGA